MTLPSVHTSMIITFYQEHEIMNYIINLDDIRLTYKKDSLRVELKKTKQQPNWPDKVKGLGICVSDDPTLNHAGDWMNMGCTRILIVMRDVKRIKKKYLCYEGTMTSQSFIVPERIPENAYHPSNLFV